MVPLTRAFGWGKEDVDAFPVEVMKDMNNKMLTGHCKLSVSYSRAVLIPVKHSIYGKKPEAQSNILAVLNGFLRPIISVPLPLDKTIKKQCEIYNHQYFEVDYLSAIAIALRCVVLPCLRDKASKNRREHPSYKREYPS